MRWFWRWLSGKILSSVMFEVERDSSFIISVNYDASDEDVSALRAFLDGAGLGGRYVIVMSDKLAVVKFD